MNAGHDNAIPLKVTLCEYRGKDTSIFIDAEISEEGTLVVSGQDVGKAPLEIWGDTDYEYWVYVAAAHKARLLNQLIQDVFQVAPLPTVPPAPAPASPEEADYRAFLARQTLPPDTAQWSERQKDVALLLLLQKRYQGDLSAVSALRDWLNAHDIPYTFDSWV